VSRPHFSLARPLNCFQFPSIRFQSIARFCLFLFRLAQKLLSVTTRDWRDFYGYFAPEGGLTAGPLLFPGCPGILDDPSPLFGNLHIVQTRSISSMRTQADMS
jgi:hypothetical protein